jgi:hypothetical protein
MMALTHCEELIKFFTMIFAVFEGKSVESSVCFRVISACKSRQNRSLMEIGGRCRNLAKRT